MENKKYEQMMKDCESIEMSKSVDELSSLTDDMFNLWCENNIRYLEGLKKQFWVLEGFNFIEIKKMKELNSISIEKLKELQKGGRNFLNDRKDEKITNFEMSWRQFCERFMILQSRA